MGRLDVVDMTIHELLNDLPRVLYESATSTEFLSDRGVAVTDQDARTGSPVSAPSVNGQGDNSGGSAADSWGLPDITSDHTCVSRTSERRPERENVSGGEGG